MRSNLASILLASDLDGTLLNTRRNISHENLKAIRKFEAAGGKFTIASGRNIASVKPYIAKLNLKYPAVLFNGCLLYDFNKEEILWQTELSSDLYEQLLEVLEAYPFTGIEFLTADKIYVMRENAVVREHLKIEDIPFSTCTPATIPDHAIKILIGAEEKKLKDVRNHLLSLEDIEATFVQSAPFYLEILPKNTTKATGLLHLTELLGIELKDTVVIGDYDNDIEMIQEAGLGVAVGNANDHIKSIADMVVGNNNEHAVAQLIDHLLQ